MKRVLIISPYFTPSNLAGVQRARLMSAHLREFGWEPVVVCADPRCYEEPNDEASVALLPENLRVERVGAWPAWLCRPLGVGDVALRAQWSLRWRVSKLLRSEGADLIFTTVLPGYTSLVGAWAKSKFGLPFVLDYQDPWISDWGARQRRLSKAGIAHWLALKLEPRVVRHADALTAVSDGTIETLRARQLIHNGTPIKIIPIGTDEKDHQVAAQIGKSAISNSELGNRNSPFHLAYLGTLTDRMLPALRTVLLAMKQLATVSQQFRLHLIGTSAQPTGDDTLGVARILQETGVSDFVRLQPRRVPYLDALRTMQKADALLLLGSTDFHYTASKIFPCWLSGKPVIALFHAASTINQLALELGGVRVIKYDGATGPEAHVHEVAAALREIQVRDINALSPRNEHAFEPYSARGVARSYGVLFDRVVAKQTVAADN